MKSRTHKMTEGDPLRTILVFAVPMILSNLFQQLYNVVDTLIVGKMLGMNALAAVGNAGTITAVFVQLSTGLALGGSIVIAQYFGAGRTDKIWLCMSTSVIFSIAVSLISMTGIWIFARSLLVLVNTPAGIMDMGTRYLRFYFLGCVPIFIYNALNGVYTALGDSETPLKFLIVSSILNIFLDLVFIVGLDRGVEGAALATALSQLAAAVMALRDIPRLLADFGHEKSEGIFDRELLAVMLRFALPSALQQSIVSVGTVVVQATINSFGTAVIAGSAAANKVINLASAVSINYGNAYSNYVGQNIGAGKEERIWPGLKASILVCGAISLAMTVVFELFPEQIILLFLQQGEADLAMALSVGVRYIRAVGAVMVIFSTYMLMKATFKGSGDMTWFIFVTLLSFLIRLFLTTGFAHIIGMEMIWWSICAGWIISLGVTVGRYMQGGWKNKRIGGAVKKG